MTQTAFNRDNVLSEDDRLKSARKCLALLESETGMMDDKEAQFVADMQEKLTVGACLSGSLRGCVTWFQNTQREERRS